MTTRLHPDEAGTGPVAGGVSSGAGAPRYLGLDVGAETVKLVELVREGGVLRWTRRQMLEHGKEPGRVLPELLGRWDWPSARAAAVSGRLGPQIHLPRVPTQQAQARACRFLLGDEPATIVSIGSHGFSVLELRGPGFEVFRENSRCSQGTGNFLRQLVERFSLTIEEASDLAARVEQPAPLAGRCPVILKSDMTHLANKGEDRARILAGLFDAVCENVLVLLKPGGSPRRVVLIGGVSRSARVQRTMRQWLGRHGFTLLDLEGDDALFFEALGSALVAAESPAPPPPLEELIRARRESRFERVPALAASLHKVRRLPPRPPARVSGPDTRLVLGLDIGSTGSKAVALEARLCEVVWEGYRSTLGDPVGAAQALLRQFAASPAGAGRVIAFGVTGSGREIVGSLLATCYGREAVFILNEIAAHAEGARHFDPRVDTIFEIGGQDAKYIRLAGGRVVDCAMNEACSAGTGSFIEEQGRKFAGIRDVAHLSREALAAPEGVSLGQHCSVFMAEIIDAAVAAGIEPRRVMAGLYDSIIQNYLNRVKGNRSVGQVIFCQGMPFSSDALAAAVARQTGSEVIVPPNPGTVGALGIALLTLRHGMHPTEADRPRLALDRFLTARVEAKDTFICKATTGCGVPGNRCRIDRLRTVVEARRQTFTWGGGCTLHEKATRKKKLPDLAPDPFREREELVRKLVADLTAVSGRPPECEASGRRALMERRPTVALGDEFMLKGLFPFFATFLHALGMDLLVAGGGDHTTLKRGIQEANVPFCAPMQQFHGLVSGLVETGADYLFVPMVRSLPRVNGEPFAVTCPIAQAGPDVVGWDLRGRIPGRLLSPVIDLGTEGFHSPEFLAACRKLAEACGCSNGQWRRAHARAVAAQRKFEEACLDLGRRALEFCAAHDLTPVVVLGRPYTIYNTVLNSNVPALLREQGAMAIPVDCYPVRSDVPSFPGMYWSYGQRILRAAHQIRRTPGHYSLYCSNYSCGPDSFNLHFYAHLMEGKPFAIIETDGHSGDAGTKTRVEAFLHCVAEDRAAWKPAVPAPDFLHLQPRPAPLRDIRRRGETLLVPWICAGSQAVAACFRGLGIAAEALPRPDAEALRQGRRHTSGKECLPLCLTLGNLLKRLERERHTDTRFAVLMPTTHGPCREGAYNLLNQIVLERLGWSRRVRIWSLEDAGYFDTMPGGFSTLLFCAVMGHDLLSAALHEVRPVETRVGAAQAIHDRHFARLVRLLETAARGGVSVPRALWEVATGRLFGVRRLLEEATAELAAVRGVRALPTVLVVGEIYVRCDEFANQFLIEQLEARGLRVRLAPFHEWLEYCDLVTRRAERAVGLSDRVSSAVQARIQDLTHRVMARALQWPDRTPVRDCLAAAEPYLRPALRGEAILTLGTPLHEWRAGRIDAVVSVGPLECMPNKIAEAQFFHVSEREGLLSLTLPVNGDPVDAEALDNFAFEVRARFEARQRGDAVPRTGWPVARLAGGGVPRVCAGCGAGPAPGPCALASTGAPSGNSACALVRPPA